MPTFDLADDYTASYVPYRHGPGYVAKGTIFHKGKPVEIFEAHGRTLPDTDKAARVKVQEVCKRLKAAKRSKAKKRGSL